MSWLIPMVVTRLIMVLGSTTLSFAALLCALCRSTALFGAVIDHLVIVPMFLRYSDVRDKQRSDGKAG